MNEIVEKIKILAKDKTLLYVEDNTGLRENMSKLIVKIFGNVTLAHDGQAGYDSFVQNRPAIVLTDINMPQLNGFDMLRKMKVTEPDLKVIVLSAHDDKEHLHMAIKLGVFRYLHKPAKLPTLLAAIHEALLSIQAQENRRIFLNQMQSIFNYQNNMVIMMSEDGFTLSNKRFLDFFNVVDIEDFNDKFRDLDSILLPHDEFLSSSSEYSWMQQVLFDPGKLFHTKIKNDKGENRHLILKSREVPDKKGYCVLSFDDVTELNLMSLFDKKTTMSDKQLEDKQSVLTFMKLVKENSAEVKIHNFYKGLTIVNPAVIAKITDEEVVLKTAYPQLKIVQLTEFMTISSEIFPKSVICKSIKKVDVDKQAIIIDDMSFALRTSTDRKYTRLEAGSNQKCTLFYKGITFNGKVAVVDISEVSAKISINALPPGMKIDTAVTISLNLKIGSINFSMITDAKVYRIDENLNAYFLIILFELQENDRNKIKEYLVSRQMELIHEFKKLNIL